jgi:hypothetical protein
LVLIVLFIGSEVVLFLIGKEKRLAVLLVMEKRK